MGFEKSESRAKQNDSRSSLTSVMSTANLIQMQKTIGNKAVQRMIASMNRPQQVAQRVEERSDQESVGNEQAKSEPAEKSAPEAELEENTGESEQEEELPEVQFDMAGEEHELYIEMQGDQPKLMMASAIGTALDARIKKWMKSGLSQSDTQLANGWLQDVANIEQAITNGVSGAKMSIFNLAMSISGCAHDNNITDLLPPEDPLEGNVGTYGTLSAQTTGTELTADHEPSDNMMWNLQAMRFKIKTDQGDFVDRVFPTGFGYSTNQAICMVMNNGRHARTRTFGGGSGTSMQNDFGTIQGHATTGYYYVEYALPPNTTLTQKDVDETRDEAKVLAKQVATTALNRDLATVKSIYNDASWNISSTLKQKVAQAANTIKSQNQSAWKGLF